MRLPLLVLPVFFIASPLPADGPHIALHASEGQYTATLFTAPDPLVTGKVQYALLVTQGEGGPAALVRGAKVSAKLGGQTPVESSLGASGSEWAGSAVLQKSGQYALAVEFEGERGQRTHLTGTLSVAENHGRRDSLLWAVLFPLVAILLFLTNQHAKQKFRTHGGT